MRKRWLGNHLELLKNMEAWDGIEPPTRGFSVSIRSIISIIIGAASSILGSF
jgi:hypothetical protein